MNCERSYRYSYERLVGVFLFLHFVLVCMIKYATDADCEIFWLCHVSLFIAALGFFFRLDYLISVALTQIFFFHILWYIDITSYLATGEYVLGIASYLQDADFLIWISTVHHFYLLPLLLLFVVRLRVSFHPLSSLAGATIVLGSLVVMSHVLFNSELNINYAYRIEMFPQSVLVHWINGHEGFVYIALGVSFISLGIYLPTIVILRRIAELGIHCQSTAHQAHHEYHPSIS